MTTLKLLTIRIFAIASISTLLAVANTSAEEIRVPLGQQGNKESVTEVPSAGMTKDQVRNHFGEPSGSKNPVGEPPISSWRYHGFTVYFEYNRVIHSVLAHKPI